MEELASIPDTNDVNADMRQIAADTSNRVGLHRIAFLCVASRTYSVPNGIFLEIFGSLPQCKYLI
jgi:hypothetical protein